MVQWIIVSSVLFHVLQVSLPFTTDSGDVRLVGGTSRCAGIMEIKHQGEWRPVGGPLTTQTSSVVCRHLGCGADGSIRTHLVSTRLPIWYMYVSSCGGSESALMQCKGTVVPISSTLRYEITCSALQVSLITTALQVSLITTESVGVRLVGGISNCTGTLEVKYQGEWRPAADFTSDLNLKSSSVVCRQLNCGSAAHTKWISGSAREPIWMIPSSCNGSETSLRECGTRDIKDFTSGDRLEVICSALFSQCGRAEPGAASRILGGGGSVAGTHPWQVSLQGRTKGSSEDFKHSCGGVLIASCWVLTAAHCINSSMEMQVVLGGVYLKKTIEESVQVIPVVRAILHPDYRVTKTPDGRLIALHNDVALLQLNITYSPLCAMESRYVKTACLPNQLFPDDMECVITGWGVTGNKKRSNRLLEARVPLISKQSCMAPHVYGDRLDDTMICAGRMEGGADTCQGDSGGPLVCEQDGVHYIAGVVSWGEGCAERNKPGVYANVHRYVTWINQTMSNDHIAISEDYDYSYDD